MTTYTIIGAWDADSLGNLEAAYGWPGSVDVNVRLLATLVGDFLKAYAETGAPCPEGFTIAATYGGGAGWPTEPGFTITIAGAKADHRLAVEALARAVRVHEKQEAVCVLAREESFDLVTA